MKETLSSSPVPPEPELAFGQGGESTPSAGSGAEVDPEVVVIKGPPRPSGYTPSATLKTQREEPTMNNPTNPAALNVKRSIDRQRKEQQAVTSSLGGGRVGFAFDHCGLCGAFGVWGVCFVEADSASECDGGSDGAEVEQGVCVAAGAGCGVIERVGGCGGAVGKTTFPA